MSDKKILQIIQTRSATKLKRYICSEASIFCAVAAALPYTVSPPLTNASAKPPAIIEIR